MKARDLRSPGVTEAGLDRADITENLSACQRIQHRSESAGFDWPA